MTTSHIMPQDKVPWTAIMAYMVCSVVVSLLVLYRHSVTGTVHYVWLIVPNLILAWIPLGLSVGIQVISSGTQPRPVLLFVLVILWLLFFPNAPYMITDLVHLTWVQDAISIHFDTALVFLSALTGLGLAFSSLDILHGLVRKRYSALAGWTFASIVWALSAVGIYLGRVQRLNSWDAIRSPLTVLAEVIAALKSGEAYLIMGVYAVVTIALYVAFRSARTPEGDSGR